MASLAAINSNSSDATVPLVVNHALHGTTLHKPVVPSKTHMWCLGLVSSQTPNAVMIELFTALKAAGFVCSLSLSL